METGIQEQIVSLTWKRLTWLSPAVNRDPVHFSQIISLFTKELSMNEHLFLRATRDFSKKCYKHIKYFFIDGQHRRPGWIHSQGLSSYIQLKSTCTHTRWMCDTTSIWYVTVIRWHPVVLFDKGIMSNSSVCFLSSTGFLYLQKLDKPLS